MRRLAFAAALVLMASPVAAQAPPVQNRANAAVSGSPSLLLTNAAGQSDLCIGTQTAAYGSPVLGMTINMVHRDIECARIRKSKALQALGYGAAAVQVMCDDRDVRAAMSRAGTPCELQKDHP